MRGLRVSISGLLALVAVSALWLASLRSASTWWTSLATAVTLGALLTGVLGACFLDGPERGFWAGFALFGGTFLVFVNWDWVGAQVGHDLTAGLSAAAEALFPPEPAAAAGLRGTANLAYFERVQRRTVMVGNFVQIGRLALTLVFATAGGIVGRALAARGARGDGPVPA